MEGETLAGPWPPALHLTSGQGSGGGARSGGLGPVGGSAAFPLARGLLWVLASLPGTLILRPWPLPDSRGAGGSPHPLLGVGGSPRLGFQSCLCPQAPLESAALPGLAEVSVKVMARCPPGLPSLLGAPPWALQPRPPSPGPSSWTPRPSSSARPGSPRTRPAPCR